MSAVDADGLADDATLRLSPRTAVLRFRSRPVRRVRLTVGGQRERTSFRREFVVGSSVKLRARRRVRRDGERYRFDHWSDKGPRTHELIAGERRAPVVAVYSRIPGHR